ncbi:MAG: XRE family transcriptional regulator, partial [Actinomycetota bacterium]|nr:XRE family transcriptional regulator [Actinomycetota bacterium]
MTEEEARPGWANRLRRERHARGWSQADAVAAMRTFADAQLPDGLLDQWKRWERGRNKPDEFYRPLIAATLGTVVESLFGEYRVPVRAGSTDELLIVRSGMDTHELVQRIRRSSVDDSTLDALAVTVEQMCCDYTGRAPHDLIAESRTWLNQVTRLLDERLTLTQHRDVLDAAGWLTLLIGCLEYDTGQHRAAEATRVAAMQLGTEADNSAIVGWAHEIRAWIALTSGRYRDVIAAAQAGQDAAPGRSVAVQLLAQEAKAWARMGNERNVARALENGRVLLDSLPYPERPDNHFVVDPDKFDFYAMDCYRLIGNDTLAELHASEIIRKTTNPDGTDRSPMRKAEATLTLAVVAARRGDLAAAVKQGQDALAIDRRSQPSLLMVGSELDEV